MSAQTHGEHAFEPEAYQAMNSICDEFRRRIKRSLLESNADGVVTVDAVLATAQFVSDSDWLEGFRTNEQTYKAA